MWDDGTTSPITSLNIAGDMTLGSGYCVHRGHNFTVSGGSTGGAFWTNTTFYNEAFQSDALSSIYCQNHGYNDNWRSTCLRVKPPARSTLRCGRTSNITKGNFKARLKISQARSKRRLTY